MNKPKWINKPGVKILQADGEWVLDDSPEDNKFIKYYDLVQKQIAICDFKNAIDNEFILVMKND